MHICRYIDVQVDIYCRYIDISQCFILPVNSSVTPHGSPPRRCCLALPLHHRPARQPPPGAKRCYMLRSC